ncbi:DUF3649 domain-containing protein [Burkholderia plantarii]|uniref:DUF3649 domain-containing protein n=1 Tax=Burkholderia plantarii TaxID=41899 RepID=UPI0006D8BFFA|nr:DUF3649 domain-containing protein [Burkholderia plantarii]ALK33757.1 iron uptake protein [Burkholderia plantarii]GLZ16934.1 iron transporter [Burkholderia plantarii]
MSAVSDRWRRLGPLLSRIVCAIAGGYALGALASVGAIALPIDRSQAVLTGMLVSFLFYTGAVIWVFLARTAWRAWAGLIAAAVPLLAAAGLVWSGVIAR